MAKTAKLHVIDPGANPPDLSFIPAEPASIAEEVRTIAHQVHATFGAITETDRAQLLEYHRVSQRAAEITEMMDKVKNTEPQLWLRLAAVSDKSSMLRRQLLRDLTLTRSSKPGETSASRKAGGKSGGKWSGIL